jgi:GT2 family glycosyltransferase
MGGIKNDSAITIVMLTWNALSHIKLTLKSLEPVIGRIPLIIFDNGSESDLVEYLETIQNENIKVIFSADNIGVWNARNRVTNHVETELVCYIDSDLYFPSDWLSPLVSLFKDASVGQVGPLKLSKRIIHPYRKGKGFKVYWNECEDSSSDPAKQLRKFISKNNFNTFVTDLMKSNSTISDQIEIPPRSIGGAISVTRTKLVRNPEINDPYYKNIKYGLEDIDYSWSLIKHGYQVRICPSVYVHHFEHSSLENNKIDIRTYHEDVNIFDYFIGKWLPFIKTWLKDDVNRNLSAEEAYDDEFIQLLFKKSSEPYSKRLLELFKDISVNVE